MSKGYREDITDIDSSNDEFYVESDVIDEDKKVSEVEMIYVLLEIDSDVLIYLTTMKMKNIILRKVMKALVTHGQTLQFKIKNHKRYTLHPDQELLVHK